MNFDDLEVELRDLSGSKKSKIHTVELSPTSRDPMRFTIKDYNGNFVTVLSMRLSIDGSRLEVRYFGDRSIVEVPAK
jgi:hypothetical protein